MNVRSFSGPRARSLMTLLLAAQLGTWVAPAQSRYTSDNGFLADAYGRGLTELRLAHVAVEASRDPDIQKIGHRIINEQQRANDDLKRLAQGRNVTLPTDVAQTDQATVDRLSRLQGGEFDRAYRDHLNTDYRDTIRMFEDAARTARDTEVRNVASQYANLFEQHAQTIGITGLGTGSAATAVTTPPADTTSGRSYVRERQASALGANDASLLKKVYQSSRTEVAAARLALKNSKDQQMRTLAQTILTDHENMDRDLQDIASRRGVTLPQENAEVQQNLLQKLSKASGNDFDREYHSYLTVSHRNTMKELDQAMASNDADMRNFASRYSSAVQEHMTAIQRTGEGSNR